MEKNSDLKFKVISCCSVLGFIAVWYLCTDILQLTTDITLPGPVKVLHTFIDKFTNKSPDGGTLLQHMWSSLRVALSGYAMGIIIGVPLGILMAWYRPVDLLDRKSVV